MRIIGGSHKGLRLSPPRNLPVRPTTDKAKEALFNLLQHRINLAEIAALDLFSGTGSISFELASRGAGRVVSVEKNYHGYRFIKETAAKLELEQIQPVRANVFAFLRGCQDSFDLIFADPPFDMDRIGTIPSLILEQNLLAPDGILILEHPTSYRLPESPKPDEIRKYGHASFAIYTNIS